jgi:hypothetical protein
VNEDRATGHPENIRPVVSDGRRSRDSHRRNFNSEDEAPQQRKPSLSSEGLNVTSQASTTGRSLARRLKAMTISQRNELFEQNYAEDIAPAEKMGGEKKEMQLEVVAGKIPLILDAQNAPPDQSDLDDDYLVKKRRRPRYDLEFPH